MKHFLLGGVFISGVVLMSLVATTSEYSPMLSVLSGLVTGVSLGLIVTILYRKYYRRLKNGNQNR